MNAKYEKLYSSRSLIWEEKKERFDIVCDAAQKIFNLLVQYDISSDESRGLLIDYCTLKLIEHQLFILNLKPLSNWVLCSNDKICSIDTTELDNIDWSMMSPMVLSWLYNRLMCPILKEKNNAIYTPESVVLYMVKSTIDWGTVAGQTEDLKEWAEQFKNKFGVVEIDINQISDIEKLRRLHKRLGNYSVCDPCCGCGNFPYEALHRLKELDDAMIARLKDIGVTAKQTTSIYQIHGIDLDADAIEICKRVLQMAWWECGYWQNGVRLMPIQIAFGFYLDEDNLSQIEVGDVFVEAQNKNSFWSC